MIWITLKTLATSPDTDGTVPPDPANLLDASTLTAEQLAFLSSFGLSPDADGLIDISSLTSADLDRLGSLATSADTGETVPPGPANLLNANMLTAEQLAFLSTFGLSPDADGFIDVSSLTSADLDNLKNLATSSGTGGTVPPNPANLLDASTLTAEQLAFLNTFGLRPDSDGLIDVSSLSTADRDNLNSLATNVDHGGTEPTGTTIFIDLSTLTENQRGTMQELGLITGGETSITLNTATLSDAQNNFLRSMGFTLALMLPMKTVELQNIQWGRWNNSLVENGVSVQIVDEHLVRINAGKYFAEVNPSPVANMTGSHSYSTGIASSHIGSGSAGDISSLVAGMDVIFDSGSIANGNLQIMAGDQSWFLNFDGMVQSGAVELNAIGGGLFDTTGMISDAINANLGGVFTGTEAEAFVGGFDLIDAINPLNTVEGLFTIER